MEKFEPIAAEWPVATRSLLADHERLAATHTASQLNQPLFALIRARKALADARLSIQFARRLYATDKAVRHRLESIAAAIEQEQARFPLTLLDNGGGHERPAIFEGYK